MTSPSTSASDDISGPRSHVFILLIDDDDCPDVLKMLDSLRGHRGWRSTGFGFDSIVPANLAAESCSFALRRFDPALSHTDSIFPSHPLVERNLTLLTPDLPDAKFAYVSSTSSIQTTPGGEDVRMSHPEESSEVAATTNSETDLDDSSDVDSEFFVGGLPASGNNWSSITLSFVSFWLMYLSICPIMVLGAPQFLVRMLSALSGLRLIFRLILRMSPDLTIILVPFL